MTAVPVEDIAVDDLEKLLDDGDHHQCEVIISDVQCPNDGTHVLRDSCACGKLIWVCDDHLEWVLSCTWGCFKCGAQSFRWIEV